MVGTNDENWDEVSFVIRSQYRTAVLRQLMSGPSTPSTIAEEEDISISHVSRALSKLRDESLVELLVSEGQKKGRVYGITERGEQVWQQMDAEQML